MDSISAFFYTFAVAQMLFCALVLAPRPNKSQLAYLYIALMIVSSCYLFGHIFDSRTFYPLEWISFFGGNCLLGIFWLVSLCLFSDHIKITPKHYVIASLPLIIPCTFLLWSSLQSPSSMIKQIFTYSAIVVELSLICHALAITLKYWRDDLIQQRRFLRAALISFGGFYLFLVILLEQALNMKAAWLSQIESIVLASLSLFLNFFLLQLRELSLFTSNVPLKKTVISKHRSVEVDRILTIMTEKFVYQQEGLTITELAKQLNMYEYKLRNVINGELGYRNFNDFLNYYRIKEVTAKLKNPSFHSKAILNLALDSGFRSLSSFNKAFKETHNLTPSEYRKRFCLQES
jgi:AraC-like DNA-binding protein